MDFNTPRHKRAANIAKLRAAIKNGPNFTDAGRLDELCFELRRLEMAEIDDYSGVEDAPVEFYNPKVLA